MRNWHEYFIQMAELVRQKSKDRSTKVGAVIVGKNNQVLSVGFNGFPRGVDDDVEVRHDRPAKYQFTEHAERNAIYNAARSGIRLEGTRLYLDSNPYPCVDCARAVIQAGITHVIGRDRVFGNTATSASWIESLRVGRQMMLEAGVKILVLDEDFMPKAYEGNWSDEDWKWVEPIHSIEKQERLHRNLRVVGEIECLGLKVVADPDLPVSWRLEHSED